MLSFTQEERKVIIFFSILALVSLGIRFMRKVSPALETFIRAQDCLIKVDINQAECQEFLKIKGIGPKLARNIIAHRDTHGPFRDLEEFKRIKGIGEFKYDQIKDYICIK